MNFLHKFVEAMNAFDANKHKKSIEVSQPKALLKLDHILIFSDAHWDNYQYIPVKSSELENWSLQISSS
jgi:hypothetical protein